MTASLAEIARRYREGYSMKRIAADTGVGEASVKRALLSSGVAIRPQATRRETVLLLNDYDRLDALSRERALTDEESLALERTVKLLAKMEGREMVRRGFKPRRSRERLAAS